MEPNSSTTEVKSESSRVALATGFVSAILASTCCLGPLALITLGFSGAWISNLTALEPFRPIFIGMALVALFLARRRIWAKSGCEPGQVCAAPRTRRGYKLLFGIVTALVIVALGFPLVAPWFY